MQQHMKEEGMADRMDKIGVRCDIQERRQEGMWELPNDRADLTHKQGTPVGFTDKTGDIADTRTTNRASRFQTRERNKGSHSQPEVDDVEGQGTPTRHVRTCASSTTGRPSTVSTTIYYG